MENVRQLLRHALASDMTKAEVVVYLDLLDRADAAGRAWPTTATIADDTHLSLRSVQQALRRLEQRNMLSPQRDPGRTNPTYQLLPPSAWATREKRTVVRPKRTDVRPKRTDVRPKRTDVRHKGDRKGDRKDDDVAALLVSWGIAEAEALAISHQFDHDHIRRICRLAEHYRDEGRLKSPSGFIIQGIKKNYSTTVLDRLDAERQAREQAEQARQRAAEIRHQEAEEARAKAISLREARERGLL